MKKFLPKFLRWAFSTYNKNSFHQRNFEGELPCSAIREKAQIYRDAAHIPHIYTTNNIDMFFCQGFIHAQDRIWQLEMNRRIGMGTLSAVFGKDALNTDRLTRTLGFNRLAREDVNLLTSVHKEYLSAYVDGVNFFLENRKLPIEFKLSGINPEKWNIIDILAWGRVMTWTLSHGWSGTLTRQAVLDKVGADMAEELAIMYPEGNPVEIPPGIDVNLLDIDESFEAAKGPFLVKDLEGGGRGSNAWVISAQKSDTGRPILCNDTHLVLSAPGVWYVNHLHSDEGFHCAGSTIPGLPGVLLGHNENIAWGITLAFTDVEDIFVEKINVSNPGQYEYQGKWTDFNLIEEEILVKGNDPHLEKVQISAHGPMIGKVTENPQAISLCSKSLQPNTITEGFFTINEAENWDEFSQGVEKIQAPQLNIVYADKKGNTGLYISGKVPIRKNGYGNLPVPGWSGDFEWTGEIPHTEMPHQLNPDCGYIISCNHKIIKDNFPYYLGNSFMNGYRAKKIQEKFSDNKLIDLQVCKELHGNVESIPGKRLTEGMIKGFRTAKPKAQKLIDILSRWDYSLDKGSIGGTVYEVFLYTLLRNTLEPHLDKKLTDQYLGVGAHPLLLPVSELLGHSTEAIFQMFQNPDSKWVPSGNAALHLIEKSLIDACTWLEENMGNETSEWEWGKLHIAEFHHSMSVKKPLGDVFNVGPFPIGGDTDTVHQTAYNPSAPYHATSWCPSIRFIMDVGEWDNSMVISPPGQSGVLGSKFYDNMAEIWNQGEYVPLYWSSEKVKKNSASLLELIPFSK
ncbi:MAG: penicillin acylase family protein [Candidatus Marinimicrobia bacterium]|nr:penicillin acylase family protein [Candidatus Neomarinimicrobiota bacterium]MDP6852630.1 penicillin acylase family protein [Candidatus Neomarinimicrobiota bacterium]